MKRMKYFFLLILLIGIDQVTKYWAYASFKEGDSLVILPKVLRLIYHENDGAAWGMFSGRPLFLIALTLVMTVVIAYCFFRIPQVKMYEPLRLISVMVAAGAIGNNLLDRVIHRYVIDFIYFELIDFPVFNVADMYIVIGVILLALLILFKYKDDDFSFMKRKQTD